MTHSITITDKKEAITIADGVITMTGTNPYTRIHIEGTPGVKYAQDGPIAFALGEKVTIHWGVIGKHGIYDNRQIVLSRVGDALRVSYRALFTVDVTEPVTFTVYKYREEWRWRKELRQQ